MPFKVRKSQDAISAKIAGMIGAGRTKDSLTLDRAYRQIWVQDQSFHTEKRIGTNQGLTPEGFLICENVPIARTGLMLYGEGEIYSGDDILDGGPDGLIRVERSEDQVFHPRTIASFEGKSVTDDHPSDTVLPQNFRDVEIGTTHNVRRGEGVYSDCLVADLIIKDPAAIKAVQDGKREVSCGYDADYEQSEPGRAKQYNIIGNHVALVDRGRCGPRCSIGDKAMQTRDKKLSVLDRIKAMLKGTTSDSLTKDQVAKLVADAEKEDKDESDKDKEGKTTDARLTKIEGTLDGLPTIIAAAIRDAMKDGDDDEDEITEDEAPEGETAEEKEKRLAKDSEHTNKTVDAATMKTVMQTVRAHAEILAPGHQLSMPTHDAVMTRGKFTDSMCNCKRKALDVAYRTEDGRKAIEPFLAGRTADFARMNAKTIDAIFTGAAIARAMVNDSAAGRGLRAGVTRDDFGAVPLTIDAMNQRNREFWKNNGEGAGK